MNSLRRLRPRLWLYVAQSLTVAAAIALEAQRLQSNSLYALALSTLLAKCALLPHLITRLAARHRRMFRSGGIGPLIAASLLTIAALSLTGRLTANATATLSPALALVSVGLMLAATATPGIARRRQLEVSTDEVEGGLREGPLRQLLGRS